MYELIDYIRVNYINITFGVIVIFCILVLISILNINFDKSIKKSISKIVTIETMDHNNNIFDPNFCKNNIDTGKDNSEMCKTLDKETCNTTSCCIFTDKNECISGDKHGPEFVDDNLQFYHHKDICYDSMGKCPS